MCEYCDKYNPISSKYVEFDITRVDKTEFRVTDQETNREDKIYFSFCPMCGNDLRVNNNAEPCQK